MRGYEMEWFEIKIVTRDKKESEEVIRSFVKPTVEELEKKELINLFHFFRYAPNHYILLRLYGKREDIEILIKPRLEKLKINENINDFEFNDYKPEIEKYGEEGWEIAKRLFEIGSKSAFYYMDNFDKEIKPINEYVEEGKVPVGTWLILHSMLQNMGHFTSDEVDAYFYSIINRIAGIPEKEERNRILKNIIGYLEQLKNKE